MWNRDIPPGNQISTPLALNVCEKSNGRFLHGGIMWPMQGLTGGLLSVCSAKYRLQLSDHVSLIPEVDPAQRAVLERVDSS